MATLDPDDTRPPYAQVVDVLRREIEQGERQPGDKLPPHRELASHYGVSIGTIKRALGELQGAGLVVSRQGQGAFVRTRRSVLESVPPSFSTEILKGLWVTCYQFITDGGLASHADIARIVPQSSRRVTATNYTPAPRTQEKGRELAFRNEIEAQLVNRHLIGNWKNVSDTRYFGSIHLAISPGEFVMEGYYTAFLSDIKVAAMPWKWLRIDSASLADVDLPRLTIKDPETVYELLTESTGKASLPISAVTEDGD
jgi:DNA-binding transcriptional regulator YhcF (GntR family)